MDSSPDAETRAVELLAQYGDHLRTESERIANLWSADRISSGHVDHAAMNLRIKRNVSQLPDRLTSLGLALSGASVGLTGGALLVDDLWSTGPLVAGSVSGVSGLALILAGAGLHLIRRDS